MLLQTMALTITEPAPAKINLALHVVGQRADGYHMLETLAAFTELGDRIHVEAAEKDEFHLSGRFAARLADESGANNLVLRARDGLRALLAKAGSAAPPVSIHLEKHLPIASGIGGGSADAAAAIRALLKFWQAEPDGEALAGLLTRLGADVPMCFESRPLIAAGIGERITPVAHLPALDMLLVNPLKPVSTLDIFRRLTVKTNPPLPQALPRDQEGWLRFLDTLRNDLEAPACALVDEVPQALSLLLCHGATLARMSGSGATCFGIFRDRQSAENAANAIRQARPDWFVEPTRTSAGG